jgi:integrase
VRVSNYRPRVFNKAVEKLAASANPGEPKFPKVTPHDMRHTAASLAISAGANVKAVQKMLGHKSAVMTLDVYADLFPDDLDGVAEALDAAARSAREAAADGLRTSG